MASVSIVPYGYLCELEQFTINGVDADHTDFGNKNDHDPYNAEDYGCGNMRFVAHAEQDIDILRKYSITSDEWDAICEQLTEALSFGACGWCV